MPALASPYAGEACLPSLIFCWSHLLPQACDVKPLLLLLLLPQVAVANPHLMRQSRTGPQSFVGKLAIGWLKLAVMQHATQGLHQGALRKCCASGRVLQANTSQGPVQREVLLTMSASW
jgi:hypothetical protein